VFLTHCLENETVGLQEIGLHRWHLYFGSILLGVLDDRSALPRLIVPRGKKIKELSPMSSV